MMFKTSVKLKPLGFHKMLHYKLLEDELGRNSIAKSTETCFEHKLIKIRIKICKKNV